MDWHSQMAKNGWSTADELINFMISDDFANSSFSENHEPAVPSNSSWFQTDDLELNPH